MKNIKFSEYKKLKALLEGSYYKGFPLHLVLGSYLAIMTWKPSLVQFMGYILLNAKCLKFPYSGKNIYTYSTKREDYLELINAYFPDAQVQYVRIDNSKQEMLSGFMASIIALIRGFIFVIKIQCTLKERLKLIVALSIAFKIIDELEKLDIQCDKYIAFNSSYLIESFLSWYFRKRGVKTYSLQHGMYFNYYNVIPMDVINFENVCAEKLLTWGEYSMNEIAPLMPKSSSCLVFGYPESKFPNLLLQSASDKILILLPREIYLDKISLLLEYLKKYDLQYIVRPHPSVEVEVKKTIELQENFELDTNTLLSQTLTQFKYSAVISFNSTAVFEASLYDQHLLLFVTDTSEFENPGFKEFNLSSDLMDELKNNNLFLHEVDFFSKCDYRCIDIHLNS